jgi:hypothetical protein
MSDSSTPQDGKAMSPASAGSQADAYEIRRSDGALEALTPCVRMAEQILRCVGVGAILPLYRQPQPTLTDEEREALRYFAHIQPCSKDMTQRHAATLRGLLDRLS